MSLAGRCRWCILGIIGSTLAALRTFHKYFRDSIAGRGCQQVGLGADLQRNMGITLLLWFRSFLKIFRVCHGTPGICSADTLNRQLSGFFADIGGNDIIRLTEFLHRQICVDALHDGVPQLFVISVINVTIRKDIVVVISTPYTAGVIGRISCKPDVTAVGGGSCLAGHGHIAK